MEKLVEMPSPLDAVAAVVVAVAAAEVPHLARRKNNTNRIASLKKKLCRDIYSLLYVDSLFLLSGSISSRIMGKHSIAYISLSIYS